MTARGELSPIDSGVHTVRYENGVRVEELASTEDVMSAVTFLRKRVGVDGRCVRDNANRLFELFLIPLSLRRPRSRQHGEDIVRCTVNLTFICIQKEIHPKGGYPPREAAGKSDPSR